MNDESRAVAATEARRLLRQGFEDLERGFLRVAVLVDQLEADITFAMECGSGAEVEAMEAVGSALGALMRELKSHAARTLEWEAGVCLGFGKGGGDAK